MKKGIKAILALALCIIMSLSFLGCIDQIDNGTNMSPSQAQGQVQKNEDTQGEVNSKKDINENGSYDEFDTVAQYIRAYGKLPQNFITKKEAKVLGWDSGKNLWDYAKGKSIGGDVFGNFEGLLPEKDGRKWYECDINYKGGKRGADRIVFSNDGLIYFTIDHYGSFTEYRE